MSDVAQRRAFRERISDSRSRVRANAVEYPLGLETRTLTNSATSIAKPCRTERTYQQRRTECAIRICVPVGIASNLPGGSLILCGNISSADRKKTGEQISGSSSIHFTDGDVGSIWLSLSFAPTVQCLRHGQSCFSSPSEFVGHELSESSC